ncbi:MAG: SDR family oxidoreductase [Fibromonadales bacterium]|nr:SDR family oxidoreductase [Fibromonadales bacterium]
MKEKITVITGGSSGLGFELSKLFSKIGNICIVARNDKILNVSQGDIAKHSERKVLAYKADVSKEKEVKLLYEHLTEYEIERVINCAGAGKFSNPEDITSQMVEDLIDSNLKSVMFMSANAIKAMKENGGTIVTVLSTAALKGNPQESVYCAVKWGARGYCESLKAAFKGTNIKIVTICPGGINTPFWKEDCGLKPNITKFMDPAELAEVIYNNIIEKKTLFCPDMLIEKL